MTNEPGQIEATPTSQEPQAPDEPTQPIQQDPEEDQVETQTQEELPLKERTRERIEELAQGKKTAEEALAELRQRKSVFDEFLPKPEAPQPHQPQQFDINQYADENGYIDTQKANQSVQQAIQTGTMGYQQAQQAMAYAQQVDRRMQEKEAYTKYPELDPVADKHDEDFKQLVADRLARNWATGINKPLVEVADEVSRVYSKRQTEEAVAKKAVEEYKEAQENREQGPMQKGLPVGRQEIDLPKLREISRKGSQDQQEFAIAERLRRAKL